MLDIGTAFKTYLEGKMRELTGSADRVVEIYIDEYPDECDAVCFMVQAEAGPGDPDVPTLQVCGVRIWARHTTAKDAFQMIANVDALLNRLIRVNLSDDAKMLTCLRNTGPERVNSENNTLVKYYSLYDVVVIPREG